MSKYANGRDAYIGDEVIIRTPEGSHVMATLVKVSPDGQSGLILPHPINGGYSVKLADLVRSDDALREVITHPEPCSEAPAGQ